MIIFVGHKTKGFFAEEVARKRNLEIQFITEAGDIQSQVNDILFLAGGKAECIIFELEQYISPAEEIADSMKKIEIATNAKVMSYAPSFSLNSKITMALFDQDLKLMITEGNLTHLKDQLEKNMNGFYQKNEREEIKNITQKKKEEKENHKEKKTIAVAGISRRIGTTTQAIALVKYLNHIGYKACYIELNQNKYKEKNLGMKETEISYVEKIKYWFEITKDDEDLGFISYCGVDLFYKVDKIPEVTKLNYDYYIYDYGFLGDAGFNKTAFIKEDQSIIVAGASPSELTGTQEAAENPFYGSSNLLFSFTAENEREDILKLLRSIKIGEKSNDQRSFFAPYAPDPFTLSDISYLEEMLSIEKKETQEEQGKNKKKGWFKKKKNEQV